MGYRCQCRYWGFLTCEGYAEKCNSHLDDGCSGCKEEHCCSDSTPIVGDCTGYSLTAHCTNCLCDKCKWCALPNHCTCNETSHT